MVTVFFFQLLVSCLLLSQMIPAASVASLLAASGREAATDLPPLLSLHHRKVHSMCKRMILLYVFHSLKGTDIPPN